MYFRILPVKDNNGTDPMKRYLIPVIFFFLAFSLQYFLFFSWIGFTLLLVSTTLLTLILYNLDLESKENHLDTSDTAFESETFSQIKMEQNLANSWKEDINFESQKSLSVGNLESVEKIPFFKNFDPIQKTKSILKQSLKSQVLETMKAHYFAELPKKVSQVLYAYYDGHNFEECFWQKGTIFVESEANPIEWDERDESSVRELLPSISSNKQKLYIPFTINQHLFGFVLFQTKETWNQNEIQTYWERSLQISEKIFEKLEYEKVTKNPETWLFNNSHFYQITKDSFNSKEQETLVLIKFIDTSFTKEIAICLNHFGKLEGVVGLGLFRMEEDLYSVLLPTSLLEGFTDFFKRFIEEIDTLGYPSSLAIGYSNKNASNGKYDLWIKNLYLSLEESILYNAA
ncbi:MAG: hypothetical protein MUF77_00100 [Leptospira sp.]|nr:hypothetical protein [Leptospira sp.]